MRIERGNAASPQGQARCHPVLNPVVAHALLGVLLLALVAAAAGCSQGSLGAVSKPAAPSPVLSAGALARATAAEFMDEMVAGNLQAQWDLLGEVAKRHWPSESARASMLEAKFSGAARLASFTLGPAQAGAIWNSSESPDTVVTGAYSVPVSVDFENPDSLLPAGVAKDYEALDLLVAPPQRAAPQNVRGLSVVPANSDFDSMEVLGEGPASLDAPIIEPPHIQSRTAAVPILMYHLVGPLPRRSEFTREYSYDLDFNLTVPPAQFTSEMDYLADHDYRSISLVALTDFLLYDLPLPAHPVVLTFDDGYASEFEYALPVLQEDDLTATFFPCSGLIGEKSGAEEYMSAADLVHLTTSGFWVEDHTYNDGTALWGRPLSEIRLLTSNTAKVLEGITAVPIQFISYSGLWPYPSPKTAHPAETELFQQLASLGYVAGLQDNWLGRFAWGESSTNLWELPRVRAYPGEPLSVFVGLLSYG